MVRIKKYSNRRLYDTRSSAYVNLEQLAAMIREGEHIEVVDAGTGEDLTRAVLLQILLESGGMIELFPSGFLHRVIRGSLDTPLQRMAMQQAAAGLALLDSQLDQLEHRFSWMSNGPRGRAETWERPDVVAEPDHGYAGKPRREEGESREEADDLDALRARLAALEGRLRKG